MKVWMKLAGHGKKFLVCDDAQSKCGGIEGLVLRFSDGPDSGDYDGCFVLAWEDFEKLVFEARNDRRASTE